MGDTRGRNTADLDFVGSIVYYVLSHFLLSVCKNYRADFSTISEW